MRATCKTCYTILKIKAVQNGIYHTSINGTDGPFHPIPELSHQTSNRCSPRKAEESDNENLRLRSSFNINSTYTVHFTSRGRLVNLEKFERLPFPVSHPTSCS